MHPVSMKKHPWISIVLFLALIPMLLHSGTVTDGARYGLLLWYQSVVPALFPFMVISGLIVQFGGVQILMEPFYHMLRYFLPVTRNGCYVLISGLLCGYPMGAKTCAEFVSDKRITETEGRFLMAICNHPSPMFLLGYVYPFFSESFAPWNLLLSIYGPILFLALAARKYDQESIDENDIVPAREQTVDAVILSAVTVLCKIGGYLVLFSIVIVFLRNMSFLSPNLRLFFIGALEMTTGIRELASSLPPRQAFIASTAVLSFGGCSGIFQTKSVLTVSDSVHAKKAGLSIRPYIFWKMIHAVLSAGIAALVCNI